MQNGDEASPSIILAGRALLMKMLVPLEPCGILSSNFVYLCILTFSSSKILAGRALLVKMLITLPHGIFCSNFVYLLIVF